MFRKTDRRHHTTQFKFVQINDLLQVVSRYIQKGFPIIQQLYQSTGNNEKAPCHFESAMGFNIQMKLYSIIPLHFE